MRKFFFILIMAVLLAGLSVPPAQAATVGGAVLTADGNGIPNAIVGIQQIDARRPYAARAVTGRGGIFVFENLPAGRYIVSTLTRRGGARTEVAVRQDGAARVRLVIGGRRVGGVDFNGDER